MAFLDSQNGAPSGFVRFRNTEGASTALGGLAGVPLGGAPLAWRQLSIAEAQAYRDEVQASKFQRENEPFAKGGGKGGFGRGAPRGWGGFGGRGRGRMQF